MNRNKLISQLLDQNKVSIVFILLLFIFFISSAFFAMNLKTGIIPDETEHFAVSKQYSTSWGIPTDSHKTYIYGPLAHKPYLYYWLNGRAIYALKSINPRADDWTILVSLRFLNIFYSLFTILFAYLLAKEIIQNSWRQLLVVFLLTNTLMFVFLSSGVNYDNLVNLCSFASIFFLIRLFNGGQFYKNSFGWLIFILIGTLTKLTVLPLAVIMGILWIIDFIRNRGGIDFYAFFEKKTIILFVIFIILVTLNLGLYVENIQKFRTLIPACPQIFTQSQCDQTISVTHYEGVFLPEKLTYLDVLRGYPDPIEWFFEFWIGRMMVMIYGIFGHKYYFPELIISLYRLLAFWIAIIAIRYWKKPSFIHFSLYTILIFYTIVLLRVNYQGELTTGFKHVAIQGRYIFPVIGICYSMMVYFVFQLPNIIARKITVNFIVFLFLLGSWMSPLSELIIPSFSVVFPTLSIPPEQPIVELVDGVEVSQDFISYCEGTIDQIDIMFSAKQNDYANSVIFRMLDLSNDQVVVEQIIPYATIEDNTWHSILIQSGLNSLDKTYLITFTSPKGSPDEAVRVLGSFSDKFPEGQAMVNGEKIEGDLSFRYHCTQPVFRGWFY